MPDKSLVIASFKYGLDTRRESLASLPGTLQVCQNAFINSGGEIEKRRAFVLVGTLPAGPNDGLIPVGFQDTDTGIMVFSFDTSPGGLPTNIVWQTLVYPQHGGVLPPGTVSTATYSTSFKGKAFVLINFDFTTVTFAYYNGANVPQITDGDLTSLQTLPVINTLATYLAAIVNRIDGWLAHANVTAHQTSDSLGYHEIANAGSVLVMSPPGVHFTPVIENNNSAAGLLGVNLIDQNYQGVPNIAASTTFLLTAGTNGTITITAPALANGSGTVALTGGAINFDTDLPTTAADVVTAINNLTFSTGYSAASTGVQITIYAPFSFGAVTFNATVVTTGDITTGTTPNPPQTKLVLSLTPSTISGQFDRSGQFHKAIVAAVTGNSGTVNFVWVKCNPDGSTPVTNPSILVLGYATGPSNTVGASGTYTGGTGPMFIDYFKCTVTDSGPVPGTKSIVFTASVR